MDKVTIVSADGHAVMPTDLWPEYLDAKYHDALPALIAENDINAKAMIPLNDMMMVPSYDVFDEDRAYRSGGWEGAWNADVRLEQMDREGTAAELVYHGFFRVADLGFSVMSDTYPDEVIDAGVRAHDRWALDTFGAASDRLLLVGAIGPCTDLDRTMEEVAWVADHGFVGTYAPGFTAMPGQAPLYDEYWDPLWALYAERGLVVVVHGGYGLDQGYAFSEIESACRRVDAAGGTSIDLITELTNSIFSADFFSHLGHRRAMWQIMLGGVFDRHPDLKLMMTEVRADWIPATVEYLDGVFEQHRADLPTNRLPSEWWQTNCLAGVSFMHKAEVEMREEIGIDTMCFGRDYPHAEGTWPNTLAYLHGLLTGVPEPEVRKILGENAIRFFDLDAEALGTVAARIGPSIDDLTAPFELDPALEAHLDDRCGYLKPAERGQRLAEIEALLHDDLVRVGAAPS
jgi:predicted TIM-barrel fold metal-dependent hydrolase